MFTFEPGQTDFFLIKGNVTFGKILQKKSYGHFDPQAEIEIVNIRLQAISELKSKKPKIKILFIKTP